MAEHEVDYIEAEDQEGWTPLPILVIGRKFLGTGQEEGQLPNALAKSSGQLPRPADTSTQ